MIAHYLRGDEQCVYRCSSSVVVVQQHTITSPWHDHAWTSHCCSSRSACYWRWPEHRSLLPRGQVATSTLQWRPLLQQLH